MNFPCSRCGQCCQQIQGIDALKALNRGDGTCIHYRPSVGCSIYNDRPLVCRIDEGYGVFAAASMSKADYYQRNAEVCNTLQEMAGIPEVLRIVL